MISLIRAHPFCYPMIARWLIGLMIEGVYALAYKFSEGSPTSDPFYPSFLHANDGDLDQFPRKKYLLRVGTSERKNLRPVRGE